MSFVDPLNIAEDDMTKHSTLIGGSTADRLLHCPGSFQLIQSLPDQVEVPSEYANYGSAMHAVMDRLMALYAEGFPPIGVMIETAEEFVGEFFYDRELTAEHIKDSIIPALESLDELMTEYDGGFRVLANEAKVQFPSIPGGFGTTDLLIGNHVWVVLVDWKFGQGVPVPALHKDPQGDRVNSQLLFYFAGAINSLPKKLFTKKRFAVAIVQPRVPDETQRLTHTPISRAEISYFIEDVENAVVSALQKNPPLGEGEHCKWCPAFPICPLKSAALFEISELGVTPPRPVPANADDGTYGEFLAKAKRLVDMVDGYKKQVDEALHSYMENGGKVPGWDLAYKKKLRQWIDGDTVHNTLHQLGFDTTEIWTQKLRTFAETDKTARRLGVKIPDHLRVAPESTETTVVPTGTAVGRIVDRDTAEAEFIAALKLLQNS